jgi:hypothetical protein
VSYNIKYKSTLSSTWLTTSSSGTSISVSGLAASTVYQFQLQSVCSSGLSAYSSLATFTTTALTVGCNIPTGLFTSSITSASATLHWASTGALSYVVRYKQVNSPAWTTVSSSSTLRTISWLAKNKNYEFQVQSMCSSGSSSFSPSAYFTTTP